MIALACAAAAAAGTASLWAQTPRASLADLIQAGNRRAALGSIRAGVDVNEAQPDGTRPIHWAVYQLDYEIVDALIARKARIDVTNEFGASPLREATRLQDARLVKTLLAAGARPDLANEDGETPLMLAIKAGDLSVVEMLLKAGSNVNVMERLQNQTPLMWAAAAPRNAGAMVKSLLLRGADVKPRARYADWPSQISSEPRVQYRPVGGLTALLYAARHGCYDCVEGLLGAGADVNVPTPEGVTPLMLALDNDYNDVAQLLLARGANPNVWDWWGRTALYIAIDRKPVGGVGRGGRGQRDGAPGVSTPGRQLASSMEIITALLAMGVEVNPQLNMRRPSRGGTAGRYNEYFQNTGTTPLMRAVIAGDTEVASALLARGAAPDIGSMGLTPLLIAAGLGASGGEPGGAGAAATAAPRASPNLALMDLLVRHGADVNARVTGSKTYTMRVFRYPPSRTDGQSALHEAAQSGRADVVRYLLEKGADPELVDIEGHRPIDLVRSGTSASAVTPSAEAAGRGGRPAVGASPAATAEIRAMLQDAAASRPPQTK